MQNIYLTLMHYHVWNISTNKLTSWRFDDCMTMDWHLSLFNRKDRNKLEFKYLSEYWNILLWNCFLQFRGIRKKHSSLFEHDPSSNQVFSIEILFMHLIILWYFNYHFSLHTKRVHLLCPYLTNVWFLLQQWKRRLHIHTLSLT